MRLILISHSLCPYVQSAVIALHEKEAVYKRVDIDLKAKPDWFRAISPLGKTPVLCVNDVAIFESAVICEYLEEILEPSLHPSSPLLRAQHRAWMEFASSLLGLIWTMCMTEDEAVLQTSMQTLHERFSQIEQVLQQGPYFSGSRFSLVDAAFGPVFRYVGVLGRVFACGPFDSLPKVMHWQDAVMQRRSVQTAVSPDYAEQLKRLLISHGGIIGQRLADHELRHSHPGTAARLQDG